MKAIQLLRNYHKTEEAYFEQGKDKITLQNQTMLRISCIIYCFILAFYTTLSIALGESPLLIWMYFIFDAAHLVLCIIVFTQSERIKLNYKRTQHVCITLEGTFLLFFALEGGLASTTAYSMYVPIAILLVLLLFVHKTNFTLIITFSYVLVFLLASFLNKTPEAFFGDLQIGIASLISSLVGYFLIANMRHQTIESLHNFEVLSRTDPLTGLQNRRSLTETSEKLLQMPNRSFAFIILDIDNFKSINDSYGHTFGDEVLVKVSALLKHCFRNGDAVYRLGGDEYAILVDCCGNVDVVKRRAEVVLSQLSSLELSEKDCKVECSIGITFRRADDNFESLFSRADHAMYEIKTSTKNGLRIV